MEGALARSARGDALAFGEMVREHQAMVFSMAYYFLHDRSAAEEVAQDVFLRLHRNLAGIKSPAHLMLWLRKVTTRRCIDEIRRNPARPQMSLEEAPEPADARPFTDPLLARRLRQLVASLPEKARMIVILRFQEELDLAEIAEILDIPINTVKSRLQRSLAMLREKLQAVMEITSYEAP
jgi:RNA polymerase sigma-70 factor (ECF subfamily)